MTLAPWCVNEKWEFGKRANGRPYAVVTGRERCPDKYRRNPLWWFRNDFQQSVQQAPWFHGPDPTVQGYQGPPWPEAQREAAWTYQRNPLQNFNMFVTGIADRNYTVDVMEGWNDTQVIQRNDLIDPKTGLPGEGVQRHRLTLDDGSVKQWYCKCINPTEDKKGSVTSYGWQPSGLFELKYNRPEWIKMQQTIAAGSTPLSTLETV